MNEREAEIKAVEEQQNRMIRDRVRDRLRVLETLKNGYEQREPEEKTKRVSIDQVPEHLRDNPYHLLSYGFTAFNDDDNGNPDA